jgi:hypothetical protein
MQNPNARPPAAGETETSRQEQLGWEAQTIEEALRSSDEEGTISFTEIVAWVESWDTLDRAAQDSR